LSLDDLAAGITLTDDQLKQEFQTHKDEFRTPEQRNLQQILLSDEATAKEAHAQLVSGKSFETVAKDVAKADPAGLDLGWVKQDDLPAELAGPIFALKEGEVTEPLKSGFGYSIVRLVAIKPAEEQSFEQVKDKLAKEVGRDRASDRISEVANQIDDALAGGGAFDDIAKRFALKLATATDVDSDGRDAQGQTADLPQPHANILKSAFGTERGQLSPLGELGEEGYFIVQVDKVTPAATRPLAEVHDDAAKRWQAEARQQALGKLAGEIAVDVGLGKKLTDIAAVKGLTVVTTPPLQRTGTVKDVPPALIAKLFDAQEGGAVTEAAGDAYLVARLDAVVPADPVKDTAGVATLSRELGSTMQNDAVSEYDQALRRNFPVEVDKASLDRVL
jgi:peptidyl-prolyl cis-trans isomerase D